MKQLLQNMRDGKTRVVDVPVPTPGPEMALVKTAVSLVSAGTERAVVEFAEKSLIRKAASRPDLVRQVLDKARREGIISTVSAVFNRLDKPLALGYSSAGTIVELGPGMEGFKVGQRVACAGGGYAVHAEYAVVPKNLIVRLPDVVDFESAAFTTICAIALHGFRLAEPQIGDTVAVIGMGLLGLLSAMIARAAGCQVLGIDVDSKRVEFAKELGFQVCIRSQAEEVAMAFSRGRGFDIVQVCAGTSTNDPVELAGAIARDKGQVVAVGVVGTEVPRNVYFAKELSFINSRSYGPGRYDPKYEEGGRDYPYAYVRWTEGRNLEAVVDLMASGTLDVQPLITHHFPIEQAEKAYELITSKREGPFVGVLLTYEPLEVQTLEALKRVQLDAQFTTRTDQISLGVLGSGNFATAVLLPTLRSIKDVNLVAVASSGGVSASGAARRFGFSYATSDGMQVINDPSVNTLAILTRHHLHAGQVMSGLRARKHVFCEKPLALNHEELDEIISILQEDNQPLLMVGFNRRFAPMAVRLREFISESMEPLVAHYRVNAGYLPPEHWLHDYEQGGGRIIGEGCHFIDFLTFLVGEPPVSVSAHSIPGLGIYQEDNVVLNFTFPDGSIGTVSYLANGDKAYPKERVEVFCGGRVAVLDDFRSLELIHSGRRKVKRSWLRQDKGHKAEWIAFVQAIKQGGPPPIPYEHLIGVAKATFASVLALRSE
jgi:predicted dehydrogenase/threonine dehydrogenase-like Zn-dependent dehydrogenase